MATPYTGLAQLSIFMDGDHCDMEIPPESDESSDHYTDVMMTIMASQITSLTVVYSTVYSDADQIKHQSSASLAFVGGIHRDRWIPRTKGQLSGKCFHLMTSSDFAKFTRLVILSSHLEMLSRAWLAYCLVQSKISEWLDDWNWRSWRNCGTYFARF